MRERKAIIERIRNDFAQAQRREKLLSTSYSSQATLVTAESEKSIQYNILKREVDTTRSVYEGMFQRVKEAAIASAIRATNVRIVDMAAAPKFPYKPNLRMNGMLGLLAGLFLGVAFAVMRERANRTIQAPGDAQFYLNLPELGVIPEATAHSRHIGYRARRKKLAVGQALPPANGVSASSEQVAPSDVAHSDIAHSDVAHSDFAHSDVAHSDVAHSDVAHSDVSQHGNFNVSQLGNSTVGQVGNLRPIGNRPLNSSPTNTHPSPLPPLSASPDRVELITHQRKRCIAAESFRVVLASILFSGENGSRPRVLVLTSASPTEGKTTVTSNLAIALAEIHRKVLLIDADMRKPRLHDIFQVPNDRGLSTVLQQPTLTEESLQGVVFETAIPNLFVLPTGPSAASGLLYSPVLPELLKRFKKEFDMVLIDTPPMLQMPDARVVGRQADAVVMVVRAGQTTRDAAIAARERLAEDGTRVLGTILNDWNPKQSPNGYYGSSNGYGYYRGYSNHSYVADKND